MAINEYYVMRLLWVNFIFIWVCCSVALAVLYLFSAVNQDLRERFRLADIPSLFLDGYLNLFCLDFYRKVYGASDVAWNHIQAITIAD